MLPTKFILSRKQSSDNAVTNALSISRYAHWPALSPFRPWSIRCIPLALVTAAAIEDSIRPGASVWSSVRDASLRSSAALYVSLRPFVPRPRTDIQTESR